MHRLGGTCTWRELRRAVSWRLISRAVHAGLVQHPGNGVYTLPGADDARVVARRITGVVSHRTAAPHWGWKVKTTPDLPDVTVPANRKLRPSTTGLSTPQRPVLAVERGATALAANPFESTLRAVARAIAGTDGIPQHRIRYDDFYARVDLADDALDIVLEADSFEFHGQRAALTRDCASGTTSSSPEDGSCCASPGSR